ncbi:MAG TPA: RNA polymerase subunit sigma, partial [Luteimonas sp.]|nr:RNA polymerase subunit sigma [Luteimonas sp.]
MDDRPAQSPAGPRPAPGAADPADDALMLAWAGGDASAFERLYGRHRTRLYRYFLRQVRDAALA